MGKRLMAFSYFGGKANHCEWVLQHLVHTKSYVEVFGGSAVVLLNKKPAPIETYNDINGTVVNFFRQLRENADELIEQIYLTPYSREEYFACYKTMNDGTDIDRARKFFVVVNQSFNATYSRQTGWKISTNVCRSRVSEIINRWDGKIGNLYKIVERLRSVQISNWSYEELFKKFTTRDVLFYCDPPYVHETRCNNNEYEFEMDVAAHEKFLSAAKGLSSFCAISGYENELYQDMLKDWHLVKAKEKRDTMLHSIRQECLWMNYDIRTVRNELVFPE